MTGVDAWNDGGKGAAFGMERATSIPNFQFLIVRMDRMARLMLDLGCLSVP